MGKTQKIDEFHCHEILDRSSIICDMLSDYLLDHPAMTPKMKKDIDKAIELVYDVGNESNNIIKHKGI